MSNLWAYNPDVCNGDICPMNCDICPKQEKAAGYDDEPSDRDLEMGFDPYLGCYTDDC